MSSVMEIGADGMSSTGGSLLRAVLNKNGSLTHIHSSIISGSCTHATRRSTQTHKHTLTCLPTRAHNVNTPCMFTHMLRHLLSHPQAAQGERGDECA